MDLFSSFEGLSLEELDLEGVEVPSEVEFVSYCIIILSIAFFGIGQTDANSSMFESLSL